MESFYEAFNDKHTYPTAWIQDKEKMPPHFHNALEFVGVAEGCLDVMVDGRKRTIGAGEIMIAGSMSPHSIQSRCNGKYYCVQLPRDLAFEWNPLLADKTFSDISIKDDHGMLGLMDIAVNVSKSGLFEKFSEEWATELRLIISALTGLVRKSTGLVPRHSMTDLTARAVELIDRRYHEKLRLSDISRELLCSSQVLSLQFRDVMGISINDYINTLRVNEFRRLLNDREVSLEEAVERAGFQSMRTAYRCYKAVYASTPRSK